MSGVPMMFDIERLELELQEDRAKVARAEARFKANEAAIQLVIDMAIAQLQAPWLALAAYVRAMEAPR